MLRVFLAWQAPDAPVEVPALELVPFDRTGFTVVAWGGCQVP